MTKEIAGTIQQSAISPSDGALISSTLINAPVSTTGLLESHVASDSKVPPCMLQFSFFLQ